eukprot:CAMPEP_0206229766 /NCGR_PEP_ID=MMETSP0047_2-20121206/9875_1 /ASSEMBLY_ACC=CAM_ASM_000192 /TAXON_ID=195065 /ORGANISM="Chroomonas mesostigmatica_cf, Strain CCMP1168" /LENGTH=115 /DNA_ID=CAMNT_0053653093 /DNA_START=336 /DNA_END=686 /DNA_ORIENTATION=+
MEHGGMPWMNRSYNMRPHMSPPRQAISPVPRSPVSPVISHYPDTLRHPQNEEPDTHKVCLPKFGAVQRSPEGDLVDFSPSPSASRSSPSANRSPPLSPMLSTGSYPHRVPYFMHV